MGTAPWVVSIRVDGLARYRLWAAGLAVDLWTLLSFSARRFQANVDAGAARAKEARRARGRRGGPGHPVDITVAYPDSVHPGERLGLFTIIVLSEGVAQFVVVGSSVQGDWSVRVLGLGGVLLLVSTWALSLVHGYGGVPDLGAAALPPSVRRLLCASFAVYVLTGLTGTVAAQAAAGEGPRRRGLLAHSLPPPAVALLTALSVGGCRPLPWSGCP